MSSRKPLSDGTDSELFDDGIISFDDLDSDTDLDFNREAVRDWFLESSIAELYDEEETDDDDQDAE